MNFSIKSRNLMSKRRLSLPPKNRNRYLSIKWFLQLDDSGDGIHSEVSYIRVTKQPKPTRIMLGIISSKDHDVVRRVGGTRAGSCETTFNMLQIFISRSYGHSGVTPIRWHFFLEGHFFIFCKTLSMKLRYI